MHFSDLYKTAKPTKKSKVLEVQEGKILSIDIETTPIKAYAWGPKWETNLIEILEDSRILSFSAKWLNGKQITKGLINYAGYKKGILDDQAIMAEIWKLLDEADIIVTQNGKAFDVKAINSRLLFFGFPPPSPYKVIDTKTEMKKISKLPSYALEDMCRYYEIGSKQEHEGFSLWKKCIAGDAAAWKRMLDYNAHDVVLTEELYLKIRSWISGHPNMSAFTGKQNCNRCGSDHIQSRGYYTTKTSRYRKVYCVACGGWMKFPTAEKLPDGASKIYTNI